MAGGSGRIQDDFGHEVSCRFTRFPIEVFEERGLRPEVYLEGVGRSLEHLRDVRQTVGWAGYTRLMRNGTRGWTEPDFVELGRRFNSHNTGQIVRAMARLFYTPAEAFRFIIPEGPDRFLSCIHHEVHELGSNRIRLDSHLVPPYAPFPEQFWIARGALESLPLLYHLPLAEVDFQPTERGARYEIQLPEVRTPFAGLRRLVTWPLRGRAAQRDLRSAFSELRVRHQALQEQFEAHRSSESERNRLVMAIEKSDDGMLFVGADGRILYANSAFARMTMSPPDQVVGERVSVLARDIDGQGLLQEIATTMEQGRVWKGRYRTTWQDGSSHVRDASITPMQVDGSDEHCFVGVFRDVTREASLEQALHQRQRMESVGRLAGGVAHDFNNLLTVILGFAEVLADPTTEAGDADHAVHEITRAATSAADLTGQLLAFGRKQVHQPQRIDLNEIVREIGSMLARLIGQGVELEFELAADPALVQVDPIRIEQVVTNLVVNARDAMPGGGRLTVTTRHATPEDLAALDVELEDRGYVLLEVRDNGAGMDAVTSAQVFEPFFTTKDPGRGTGLGLSTVYGIVQQAGGEIRIQSGVGRGTTVAIYLPKSEGTVPSVSDTSSVAPRAPAHRTVLLVEDEPAVRRILQRVLEDAGMRVVACADGPQALAAAQRTPFDILVSDVVMPRLGGVELARRLREIRPESRSILISGYPAPGSQAGEPPDGTVLLAKPFSSAELLAALRSVSA